MDAVGIARRHRDRLDERYLRSTIAAVVDLAEDASLATRLDRVLAKARS